MGSVSGDSDVGGGGKEEKILVSVRVRPLNEKELERHDVSDWECINKTTIIFKSSLPERSMLPTAYTFDRVFGCDSNTKEVYEEGAKEVALSVVSGINASIFAYGQTSSGKTYTMSGITEYGISDIYDYVEKHTDREFILKFSAIEIYNEVVKDLLNPENHPLRLLDDPEKGTIVEKLTEEILQDLDHVKELLSFCEVQRQIGETSLNEMSSRSHQIIRLTIESSPRDFMGIGNTSTLSATVNFIDLAGSERASQALSQGARLKEGCHINRSLLALGTVIRKLSKGRNAHIPYRDSKLTRILQSSLGGNAKTAIICTMSPARSHIEQSRNTLLFASCAKEVVNNAQVNLVMSDKALVKQLQRELARLESELKCAAVPTITNNPDALREKDAMIAKMEKEMKELMQQRDFAQSRLEDMLKSSGDDKESRQWELQSQSSFHHAQNSCDETFSLFEASQSPDFGKIKLDALPIYSSRSEPRLKLYDVSEENHDISHLYRSTSTPRDLVDQYKKKRSKSSLHRAQNSCDVTRSVSRASQSPDFNKIKLDPSPLYFAHSEPHLELYGEPNENYNPIDFEDQYNEVPCINVVEDDNILLTKESDDLLSPSIIAQTPSVRDRKSEQVKEWTPEQSPPKPSPVRSAKVSSGSQGRTLVRSRSYKEITSSSLLDEEEEENADTPNVDTPPENFLNDIPARSGKTRKMHHSRTYGAELGKHAEVAVLNVNSGDRLILQSLEQNDSDDDKSQITSLCCDKEITNISNDVEHMKGLKQMHNQQEATEAQVKSYKNHQDTESSSDHESSIKAIVPASKSSDLPSQWPKEFEQKQREIIALWHDCGVSLIHRSYFFLLIKGDPADSFYIEVEHRRLSYLKKSCSQENPESVKNLKREREKLCRGLNKFPMFERERIYRKWGVPLDSKRRRQQVSRRVWTDTDDTEHAHESAMLVAKVFGLPEPSQAPKEMFGLSFTPQLTSRKSFGFR